MLHRPERNDHRAESLAEYRHLRRSAGHAGKKSRGAVGIGRAGEKPAAGPCHQNREQCCKEEQRPIGHHLARDHRSEVKAERGADDELAQLPASWHRAQLSAGEIAGGHRQQRLVVLVADDRDGREEQIREKEELDQAGDLHLVVKGAPAAEQQEHERAAEFAGGPRDAVLGRSGRKRGVHRGEVDRG